MWTDYISSDYQIAECTLIYLRQRNPAERNILFCAIELLAEGIERQPERDLAENLPGLDIEANFRIVHMTPAEAVDFYTAFMAGRAFIPLTTQERSDRRTPHPATISRLIQEPDWPHVVADYLEQDFWSDKKFWRNRPGGIRRHHLFQENVPPLYVGIRDEAHAALKEFVIHNLELDLFSRPGFIGSLHLILSNPIFGEVNERVSRTGTCEYTLSFRPRRALTPLKLYLTEYRIFGCGQICEADITSATTVIQLPYDPHQIEAGIVCPDRGLLWASPPTGFLRSVQMRVGIISGQRDVQVARRSERRPGEMYRVPIVHQTMNSHVGNTAPDGIAVIAKEFSAMETQKLSSQLSQRWFKDNVTEATEFLRRLIGGAADEVFVYDPYLGLTEIQRFGLANGNLRVPICMVTSAEYLRSVPRKENNLKAIKKYLEHVRGLVRGIRIEVRVVTGKRPQIHDRFIQVDKDLYLLGASLNEFGTRGTTFIKLPEPGEIEIALDSIWDGSTPIELFEFEKISIFGKIERFFRMIFSVFIRHK